MSETVAPGGVSTTLPPDQGQAPPKKDTRKQDVPLWAVVVAGIAIITFMGWLYQMNFGPRPPAPLSATERQNRGIIGDYVKKTNGDMSKLTAEDKATLYKMAGGFWPMAYGSIAKEMGLGQRSPR